MSKQTSETQATLVLTSSEPGLTLITPSTPLRRLNYFDGKFLRAADMAAEQDYLRQLVALSNQAGGSGVVNGFEVVPARGDELQINEGMAIDPDGNVVLLPQARTVRVSELIERSKQANSKALPPLAGSPQFADCVVDTAGAPEGTVTHDFDLYVITICRAEALCGEEDVYGKLCEQACVTSTDRPLRVEGLVIRAVPAQLVLPSPKTLPLSQIHLRSRAASAYYAWERERLGSLMSASALRTKVWCYGAEHYGGCEIPLAVLARAGANTLFVDIWTARRERIEPIPRRYWNWQMMMRPWDVYLAQILQFQCQLREVLAEAPVPAQDPCVNQGEVLGAAFKYFGEIQQRLLAAGDTAPQLLSLLPEGATGLTMLQASVSQVLKKVAQRPSDRVLIEGGIIELPPAGYLPVETGTTASVNDQVRALLGEGVDLRFCIVHPDYVAHALEEAQHMERISLTEGVDVPERMPEVDILVPDGVVIEEDKSRRAVAYEAEVAYKDAKDNGPVTYDGAARHQPLASGGRAFYLAASASDTKVLLNLIELVGETWKQLSVHGALSAPRSTINLTRVTRAVERLNPAALELRRFNFARASRTDVFAQPLLELAPIFSATRTALKLVPGSALWVDVISTSNIADLTVDDSSAISARVIGAVGGGSPIVGTLELAGTFRVNKTSPEGVDGRRVEGTMLDATLTFKRDQLGQGGDLHLARGMKLSATMTYAGDVETGSLTIEVVDLGGTWTPFVRVAENWTAASKQSEIAVFTFGENGEEEALARISLVDNAAVLVEGGKHTLATNALEIVNTALLSDPDFEAWATKRLFAPLGEVGTELSIHAVNDWVLFHRRRTKQCEALPVRIAPEPARSYRVHEITADNLEQAKDIYGKAQSPKEEDQKAIRAALEPATRMPDLVVTFDGGSDQLSGSVVSAIKADWPGFQPGKTLAYALIARPDTANQRALEANRLRRVISAIPSDKTATSDLQEEAALVSVPPGWSDPNTDGAILLITVELEPQCQRVFALSMKIWENFQGFLRQESQEAIQETFDRMLNPPFATTALLLPQMFDLGTAIFKANTAEATSDLNDLAIAWNKSLPGFVPVAHGMWRATEDLAFPVQKEQSETIVEAIAGVGSALEFADITNPNVDPADLQLGEACPAITFVVGNLADVRVRFVVRRADEGPAGGHIALAPPLMVVGTVSESGEVRGNFTADVVTPLSQVIGHQRYATFDLARPADSFGDPAKVAARAAALQRVLIDQNLLNLDSQPRTENLRDVDRQFLSVGGEEVDEVVFLRLLQ